MADNWYMLTLVGEDRPGIVAAITRALFEQGLNLGETSMLRLGGNFTVMLMVSGAADEAAVYASLVDVVRALGLRLHVDGIQGHLHQHVVPNIQVTVTGADRAGIVADVTGILAAHGFDILDLSSDVAGSDARPVYILQITGVAACAVEELEQSLAGMRAQGVNVNVSPIETYIG